MNSVTMGNLYIPPSREGVMATVDCGCTSVEYTKSLKLHTNHLRPMFTGQRVSVNGLRM